LGEEEVVAIIRRRPDAIIEALESRPELLAALIARLAPWDRFATKEDIDKRFEMLLGFLEGRFEDINRRFEDMNRRFEAIDRRFEDLMAYTDRRFEAMEKRFEAIDRRFEAIDKRFEDLMAYTDRRFEDMNKRFEDLRYYVDKRIGIVERLLVGFNIPILLAVLAVALKAFLG